MSAERQAGAAARTLADAALPSLRLVRDGGCDGRDTRSRLGGAPLAGPGSTWPATQDGRPLSLIGQLDSDEVNAALRENPLPAGLLLAFFYEADHRRWHSAPHGSKGEVALKWPVLCAGWVLHPAGSGTEARVRLKNARRLAPRGLT